MSEATAGTLFKAGDQVRILRKAKSYENGWTDSWVGNMDLAVGKTGIVTYLARIGKGVSVSVPGIVQCWNYPDFVLELVQPEPTPVPVTTSTTIPSVLSALTATKSTALTAAKSTARKLGQEHRYVNIDQVRHELLNLGYKSTDLGNSAGSVFRGGDFKDTGTTVRSNRNNSHSRKITVWEYAGLSTAPVAPAPVSTPTLVPATPAPTPVPAPETQYFIEYRYLDKPWAPSANTGVAGYKFDFKTATEKAIVEQHHMGSGHEYRAAPVVPTPAPVSVPIPPPSTYMIQFKSSIIHGAWYRSGNTDTKDVYTFQEATRRAAEEQQKCGREYRAVPVN